MKKKNLINFNDEIDLIVLFKILWESKIKIILITIISFLLGVGYNSQIPSSYINTLTIESRNNLDLIKYVYLKKMVEQESKDQYKKNPVPDMSDNIEKSKVIMLDKFIDELKDYEEFLFSIEKTKKIQDHFSKLNINGKSKELELFKFSKLLEIDKEEKNKKDYTINFKWHDPHEAKMILQDTLSLTLKNLKHRIITEMVQTLEFNKQKKIISDRENLVFLKEQSSIAKELDIYDNQSSVFSINIATPNIPYYLRGYNSIIKEIEIIENRKYQKFNFLKQEIDDLKNYEFSLVNYNIFLMDTESLKNTRLILIISILLGLIAGISYVIISNVIKSHTASKKNK
jgi:LPS O-antigen subunit length determinant protein (WzzB/FepE family)